MSGIIEQKYLATKRAVHGVISQQDWMCLTMDMWISRVGDGFYSLTAHFISPTFYMDHKTFQLISLAGQTLCRTEGTSGNCCQQFLSQWNVLYHRNLVKSGDM